MIQQAQPKDWWFVLQALKVLNVNGVDFFTKKRVKQLIKTHSVGFIADGVDVVGACVLKWDSKDKAVEIFAIGVCTPYQGLGIGSKLIRWSEAMAKGVDADVIFAHSYHHYNTEPFYHKKGFITAYNGESIFTFAKQI